MPIELPVVVSQAAAANNAHRELEENLVTRLMLDEGDDVRLIGSLQHLQSSSTDQLMLEGIGGDFTLISWQTPQESLSQLQILGIGGRRAAHAEDPNPPQQSGRRIYFLNLRDHQSITTVIDRIKQCSADRTTKTLQIGLLGGSLPVGRKLAPAAGKNAASKPADNMPAAAPVSASPENHALPTDHEAYDNWADNALELLVDELDQMDL